MAPNQSLVRVAGTGAVYVAPVTEAVNPITDLDPITTPYVELGYVTTDGCTFTMSRESSDLDSWQGDKIRVLTTGNPMTVEFALMETSTPVLEAAFGGGSVAVATGVATYTPEPNANTVRTMLIEFVDGDITYRYWLPKVQIEGDVSWQLVRTDSVNYPLTFGILDNTPKYLIVTDDPGVEASGGGVFAFGTSASPEAATTEGAEPELVEAE